MTAREIEPQSPAELDAMVAVKREARMRALRQAARGGGWAQPRLAMVLDAAAFLFAYIVSVRADTMLPLVFAIVVAFLQMHDAFDARINALAELLDVESRTGDAPSTAGGATGSRE